MVIKKMTVMGYRKVLWIYIAIIFILAVLNINGAGIVLNNTHILSIRLDYLVHFAIFIPLMWLVCNAYGVSFKLNVGKAVLWVVFGLVLAWLSEGVQYFIPYRAFNINDLVANTIGVLLGAVFFIFPVGQGIVHHGLHR